MNNFKTTILSLSLVLLPLLGACSHDGNDDATPSVATGGEPLIFNIAPKESFVDANPNTRATVDETTGTMTWETGDRIFVTYKFDNNVNKRYYCTLVRTVTDTWDTYDGFVPTQGSDGNPIDLSTQTKVTLTWALGATEMLSMDAIYLDGETILNGVNSDSQKSIHSATGRTADGMSYKTVNVALNAPVNLNLTHWGTRLVFNGLTPNTVYVMSGAKSYEGFVYFDASGLSYNAQDTYEFTSDANGNYVHGCEEAGGALVLKDKVTNTTVYTATIPGGKGKNYQCQVSKTGPINPGNNPDLLTPDPIVANNLVSQINGYYITVPDADINKTYTWNDVAASDPCANHGNWRMPTMKDWEAIAGWQIDQPWTQDATGGPFTMPAQLTGHDLFPVDRKYLSSVARSTGDLVWAFYISSVSDANYTSVTKTLAVNVRCVQK